MAEPHSATDQFTSSTTHVVYSVMRFLRVVRHRKEILLASLLVAAILGAIYYTTAPREYKVITKLWVMKNEPEQIDAITQDSHRQGILPTYVQLFSESRVLEPALDALGQEPAAARVDLAPFPRDQWLEEIRKRLQARAIRATDIIELSYQSGDPHAAVTVVDKIVNSYVEFINKNRESILRSIEQLLKGELASVTTQLRDKEEELKQAIAEVRDLSTGDSTVVHPAIHKANKIHEEFVDVQRKRFKLQSSLTSLDATLRQGGDLQSHLLDIEPLIGRELVLQALGLSAKDAEVLARRELSLAEERSNLEARLPYYGPNHPEIQRLRRNIASLQKEVAGYNLQRSAETQAVYNQQLGETLLSLVQENLNKTWALEQMLYEEFKQAEDEAVRVKIKLTEIQDIRLEKQRLDDQSEALLDSLKKMETNPTDVRVTVVTKPVADARPVSPKLLWVLFVCVSGGTLAGSAVVYVLDVLDDRFRSPEELREQLGAPVLAMIRRLPDTQQSGIDALQMHSAADSIESEAFRTLRTTVAFAGEKMDCLAVSSSEPGDGKTTVLANLGVACAQAGKRTLLIDADMRRPGLSRLFELRGSKGLGDIIRGEDIDVAQQASAHIRPTGANNLDVLPCGVRPSDPTGMLAGPRFADLLAWAESVYDQVLIDTPPILAASDATVIGRAVDGFILVVQPEKNHRRLVHRAAEEILAANLNFVGIVANRVGQGRGHSYYGSGYGYGYGYGYGSGYGDEDAPLNETQDESEPVGNSDDHAAPEALTSAAIVQKETTLKEKALEHKTPEHETPEPETPEHKAPTADHVDSTPRIRPRRAA